MHVKIGLWGVAGKRTVTMMVAMPPENSLPPNNDAEQFQDLDAGPIEVAVGVLVRRGEGEPRGTDGAEGAKKAKRAVRLLIARRRDDVVLGGYWEFPGGKLEAKESPGEAVVREFGEELGLSVRAVEPIARIEHRYDHGHVRLHAYLCHDAADDDQLPGEARNLAVAEHRWIAPADLPTYRFPPANGPLLRAIMDRLDPVGPGGEQA